ncbi:acyltransferase [Paracoccus aminovorans]|uniref:acyltransferase n=1 Tax=Paracoccus aminovorans TaxID=34004 RepID=UPI000B093464|nr:hypothetical protein [Paracoccus aminovorans]
MTESDLARITHERLSEPGKGRLIEPLSLFAAVQESPCLTMQSGSEGAPPAVVSNRGSGNVVFSGFSASADRLRLRIHGSDNVVFVGAHFRGGGDIAINGSNNMIYIGAFTTIGSITLNQSGDGGSFIVGDHCMISNRIQVGNTDGHAIFDKTTGERINPDRDVYIGDRVWIARDASIGKGARINDGAVVGQKSHVIGTLDAECVYAGIPARKLREGIVWSRSAENSVEEWHEGVHYQRILEKKAALIERISSAQPD